MKQVNEFKFIKIKKSESIGELILNNPGKSNCLNKELWFEIPRAVAAFEQDPAIRVVILRSEGKHFSSGIDLSFIESIMNEIMLLPTHERAPELKKRILEMQAAFSSIEESSKPYIAAIHGLCLGGAIDLVACCDVRLGTMSSTYCILETKIGIVADIGTLQRLNRVIPEARLKELALTSDFFMAPKAWQWGFLNAIYPTQSLLYRGAKSLALKMAANPSSAIAGTKKTINNSRDRTVHQGLEDVAELNSRLLSSEEMNTYFKAKLRELRK